MARDRGKEVFIEREKALDSDMAKVYIVQEPMRREGLSRSMVPARDFSDAARFGEIVFVFAGTRPSADPRESIEEVCANLSKFSPDDYLIMVGHPSLQAWTAAIAARNAGGSLRILEWVGRHGDGHYEPTPLARLW